MMVEGLDHLFEGFDLHIVLEDFDPACLSNLRALLAQVLGPCGAPCQLLEQKRLGRPNVYRLRFETSSGARSLVVKRLKIGVARRDQLVANRWLAAIGLEQHGPPLLGAAPEANGRWAWHVYEDLGDCALRPTERGEGGARAAYSPPPVFLDPERLQAAVDLIASIHFGFAGHPLLGEVRTQGDLGAHFFRSNVEDAISVVEALRPPAVALSAERRAVRDRLLARLRKLRAEEPYRTAHMKEFGGPETLVHGDLRPHNVMIGRRDNRPHVRLIDWDHAAVGLASYDLSTLLFCLPAKDRLPVLDLYEKAAARRGWWLPARKELNLLFDTAECARLANGVIWPAIAMLESQPAWAYDQLVVFDEWFEALKPALPLARPAPLLYPPAERTLEIA